MEFFGVTVIQTLCLQMPIECGVGIEIVGIDQVLMIRSISNGGPAHRSLT